MYAGKRRGGLYAGKRTKKGGLSRRLLGSLPMEEGGRRKGKGLGGILKAFMPPMISGLIGLGRHKKGGKMKWTKEARRNFAERMKKARMSR